MTTLKSLLLLLCISFSLQVYAQEKVTVRETLSLDKGWSFHKGDIPYPVIKGQRDLPERQSRIREWSRLPELR